MINSFKQLQINSWNNRVGLQIARHQGKGDPFRAVANAGINSTGVTNFTENYGTL